MFILNLIFLMRTSGTPAPYIWVAKVCGALNYPKRLTNGSWLTIHVEWLFFPLANNQSECA